MFSGTAIGVVLEANGNEVPKSGAEMMRVLAKLGEFAQLPVTYSAVDLQSGLTKPRVLLTQRPSAVLPPKPVAKPNPAFPDFFALPDFDPPSPTQAPVNTGALTKPNLEGRLFLAANMEKLNGQLTVKTFEFISWNSRKQKFDFGFIECDEKEAQIRLVDGVRCFSCHKNKGPILGQGPWSNTPHNDKLRSSVATSLNINLQSLCLPDTIGQPTRLDTGFDRNIVKQRSAAVDGFSLLIPQGPAVDAGVRVGGDLIRDRDIYRAMARTPDGRRGLTVLLGAIAAPGPLDRNSQSVKQTLDQTFSDTYSNFAHKWLAVQKAGTDTLVDFNPSGSMGSLQQVTTGSAGGWGGGSTLQTDLRVVWSGTPKQTTDYDAKRADGEHGLPSTRQPSNPKAFVKPPVALPPKPSAAVSAVGLARLIGLTEGDRAFLASQLSDAAQRIGKKTTPAAVAKDVFAGPQFSVVFTAGEIPDREDFKDRFVTGLNAVLKAKGAQEFVVARADYASGPNVAPVAGKEEAEPVVVATTACLRCHDVKGAGKVAFNPIPLLAFDPLDKTSRETWAKATPAKTRAVVLARMVKRLSEDRDMPPEDSAEYDQFRTKNPAALDAAKAWVEAELLKAK